MSRTLKKERYKRLSAANATTEENLRGRLGRMGEIIQDTTGATHSLSCGTTDRLDLLEILHRRDTRRGTTLEIEKRATRKRARCNTISGTIFRLVRFRVASSVQSSVARIFPWTTTPQCLSFKEEFPLTIPSRIVLEIDVHTLKCVPSLRRTQGHHCAHERTEGLVWISKTDATKCRSQPHCSTSFTTFAEGSLPCVFAPASKDRNEER